MAEGLNRVMLLGNLGADPELRVTPGGQAVLKLRLATNETYLDKNNVRQERTEWHRVTVWGRRAEALGQDPPEGRLALRRGPPADVELREERREALLDRGRREQHHPVRRPRPRRGSRGGAREGGGSRAPQRSRPAGGGGGGGGGADAPFDDFDAGAGGGGGGGRRPAAQPAAGTTTSRSEACTTGLRGGGAGTRLPDPP